MKAIVFDSYQTPDSNAHYLPDPTGVELFDFVSEVGYVPKFVAWELFCEKTLAPGNLDIAIQFRPDASVNSLPNNGWANYVNWPIGGKFSPNSGQLSTALSATVYFMTPIIHTLGNQIRVWIDAAAGVSGTDYWTVTPILVYSERG